MPSSKLQWFKRARNARRSQQKLARYRDQFIEYRYGTGRQNLASNGFLTTRRVPRWESEKEREAEEKRQEQQQQKKLSEGKLELWITPESPNNEVVSEDEDEKIMHALMIKAIDDLVAADASEDDDEAIMRALMIEAIYELAEADAAAEAESSSMQAPITPEELRAHKAKREAERLVERNAALEKANRQRALNGEEQQRSRRKAERDAIKKATPKDSNLRSALMKGKRCTLPIL